MATLDCMREEGGKWEVNMVRGGQLVTKLLCYTDERTVKGKRGGGREEEGGKRWRGEKRGEGRREGGRHTPC